MARDMTIEKVDEVFIVERRSQLFRADGSVQYDFCETASYIGRKNTLRVVKNASNGENTTGDGKRSVWTTRVRQVYPVVQDYTYDEFLGE